MWSSSPRTNVRDVGGPVPRSSKAVSARLIFTSFTLIFVMFDVIVDIVVMCGWSWWQRSRVLEVNEFCT